MREEGCVCEKGGDDGVCDEEVVCNEEERKQQG